MSTLSHLLKDGPIAINLGLEGFAEALQDQDVHVLHVNWSPRPQLDEETKDLLDQLL
ncbi:hypothetical protein IH601_09210 [Candidatus Bipolaricaulota bacterium]|jgi:hypothetical protein|nr:hypothetical protein [Candidatus Bipolaricaulota bacterium]